MRSFKSRALIVAASLAVAPVIMAAKGCESTAPVAPKTGVVTSITPGSAACADQQPRTVAVLYRPDGTDAGGAAWPTGLLCVTPEQSSVLSVGGRVQG